MQDQILNSVMYNATVYHRRMQVAMHEFRTSMYTWYLDLDELDSLSEKHPILIGVNRSGIYSYRDSDHFRFWNAERKENASINPANPVKMRRKENSNANSKKSGISAAATGASQVRSWVNQYFREKDQPEPHRVLLLTNLRYLGYGFNPVSFYFALDRKDRLYAILAEVNNTFGEQKPYLILLDKPVEDSEDKRIHARAWKNFYVSPFIDRDREFVFRMKRPGEKLSLGIDTYESEQPVLRAAYSGRRKAITRRSMLLNMLRFPFVTIKVIALIHWHALRLYLKKVPFFSKESTDKLIRKDENKRNEVTHAAV